MRLGQRVDATVARRFQRPIPAPRGLPRYVAPLPEWLENVGLRLAWPLVLINLLGTAFGFWYYWPQLSVTPIVMWPIVPVSPLGTLFMALSLAAWRLEISAEWLHALAFFGCLKYGLWTPFVQIFLNGPGEISVALYVFLIVSHLGMATQAFLIHRYASFPVWAVAIATSWFVLNDLLDYFLAISGGPHHTWIRAIYVNGEFDRTLAAFDHAAAFAVSMTILAVFVALTTRIELVKRS